MDSEQTLPPIAKLHGVDNYKVWSKQLKYYLMGIGVWRVVSGERVYPTHENTPHTTAEKLEELQEDWINSDDKATEVIGLLVANNKRDLIEDPTLKSAKATWDYLESLFKAKGWYLKYSVVSSLINLDINDFKTEVDLIAKHKELSKQCVELDITLDELQKIIFLEGLKNRYPVWIAIQKARKEGLPPIKELYAGLIAHVAEMEKENELTAKNSANVPRRKANPRYKGKNPNKGNLIRGRNAPIATQRGM